MRIVCISDTHGLHWELSQNKGFLLPEGDVIVHAGDFTSVGSSREVYEFLEWFGGLEGYQERIFIAGNHDFMAERDPWAFRAMLPHSVTYLQDSGYEVDGVKFWGSPWTPRFGNWAFMRKQDDLKAIYQGIPHDVDVLITHGPQRGMHDRCLNGDRAGCSELSLAIARRPSIQWHVCGHIHEAHGVFDVRGIGGTKHVNAAFLDERYRPRNAPVVIEVGR